MSSCGPKVAAQKALPPCTYPCDRLPPRGECCVRRARISRVVARTTTAPGKKTSEQLGRVSKEAVDKLQWILVSLATSSTLALLSASSSSTSHFTEDCGTLRAKINTTGGDDWISIIRKRQNNTYQIYAHNSFLSRNLVCIQTTMFRGFIKTKMQNNKEGLVVEDGWWPVCCQWAGRQCHQDQGVVGIQGNQSTQGGDQCLTTYWLEPITDPTNVGLSNLQQKAV